MCVVNKQLSSSSLFLIPSTYYDKKMVTVYPMVTHYRSEQGVLVAKSCVGVTEVLAHSFPTTFTFLKMFMKKIKEEHTALEVVHFISDEPSNQYRNQFACDMVAHFIIGGGGLRPHCHGSRRGAEMGRVMALSVR